MKWADRESRDARKSDKQKFLEWNDQCQVNVRYLMTREKCA